jgi:alpha-L-fucosidase
MAGEKWRAEELMSMVRKYQPHVLIDNRLEGSGHTMGSIFTDDPKPYSGDFYSPEQYIPVDGIKKADGSRIPWELCTTMNNQWSYVPTDTLYKTPRTIIRKLTECVSKGGNMLLNVGPDAKGHFPKESMDILKAIGKWMSKNGDSIHGCAEAGIPKPEWGRYTRRDNVIYAHIHETTIGPIPLTGIPRDCIRKIRFLADNSEVSLASWAFAVRKNPDMAFVSLGLNQNHSYPLPDEMGTVLAVYLKP